MLSPYPFAAGMGSLSNSSITLTGAYFHNGSSSTLGSRLSGGGTGAPLGAPQQPITYGGVGLTQAYATRMSALTAAVSQLQGKREAMHMQLARVHGTMAQVVTARAAIESEITADAEAMMMRLRASEGAKAAVLQADADSLSVDLAAMDYLQRSLSGFQLGGGADAATAATGGNGFSSGSGLFPGGGSASFAKAAPGGGAASASGGVSVSPGAAFDTTNATAAARGTSSSSVLDDNNPQFVNTAIAFMRAYPEFCAEADRLTSKPLKTEVSACVCITQKRCKWR